MRENSTSQDFFELKYQEAEDPWDFRSSAYEQQRYALIMDALAGRRFVRAFEPGCSIGVLTARLAAICEQLEAIDISLTAVERARERCHEYPNVHVTWGALPEAIPNGRFDLIVFSEIGYYFDPGTLTRLALTLVDRLSCGGLFLAVHWLGQSPDHVLTGDEVHDVLRAVPGLQMQASQCYEGFRLDRWSRA